MVLICYPMKECVPLFCELSTNYLVAKLDTNKTMRDLTITQATTIDILFRKGLTNLLATLFWHQPHTINTLTTCSTVILPAESITHPGRERTFFIIPILKLLPFIIPEVKINASRAEMIASKGWNVACSHRSSGVIRARSLDLRDSPARWIIYSWSFDPWEFASAAASQWDLYGVIYDLRRPGYDVTLHMLSLSTLSVRD